MRMLHFDTLEDAKKIEKMMIDSLDRYHCKYGKTYVRLLLSARTRYRASLRRNTHLVHCGYRSVI